MSTRLQVLTSSIFSLHHIVSCICTQPLALNTLCGLQSSSQILSSFRICHSPTVNERHGTLLLRGEGIPAASHCGMIIDCRLIATAAGHISLGKMVSSSPTALAVSGHLSCLQMTSGTGRNAPASESVVYQHDVCPMVMLPLSQFSDTSSGPRWYRCGAGSMDWQAGHCSPPAGPLLPSIRWVQPPAEVECLLNDPVSAG